MRKASGSKIPYLYYKLGGIFYKQNNLRVNNLLNKDDKLSEEDWKTQTNDEISRLLEKLDVQELVSKASALKNNTSCNFKPGDSIGSSAMIGCANYHAWLDFADGERWLVRIPRRRFSDAPDDLTDYLVASEYATLKFLEPTKVPAPKAFGFGLVSDPGSLVGVSYLLVEYLPGVPYYPDMFTSNIQRQQFILRQVADILIEIAKHPLPAAGSLINYGNEIKVSWMASNRFVHLGLLGPFRTALEYYSGISEQYLDIIADGQVHFQYPTEAFAFYTLARNKVETLASDSTISPDETPRFFLKHVDDKGDHLLVNAEGSITGIIDWQFSRSTPATEAFGPSYLTANLEWLYSKNTSITEADKQLANEIRHRGGNAIAHYMENNELARRFHHGLSEGLEKEEAREMLQAWRVALGTDGNPDLDAWISEICHNDPRWGRVVILNQNLA